MANYAKRNDSYSHNANINSKPGLREIHLDIISPI